MKTKSILLITLSLIISTYASAASFDGASAEKEQVYQNAKQVAIFNKPIKRGPVMRLAGFTKPIKRIPVKRAA